MGLQQQSLALRPGARHHVMCHTDDLLARMRLDDLGDEHPIPGVQAWMTTRAVADGLAEDALDRSLLGAASVHTEQQRATHGTAMDVVDQRAEQVHVH